MGEADEEVYEVEKILASAAEAGVEMFLVKWVGYDDPTWEPLEHLDGCREVLEAFRQEQRELARKKEMIKEEQEERMTKDKQYWRFVSAQGIVATPSGFLGKPRVGTSVFDANWYLRPKPLGIDPENDLHIVEVVKRPRGEKLVRVKGKGGVTEYDYEVFASLFPDALLAHLEDKIAAMEPK